MLILATLATPVMLTLGYLALIDRSPPNPMIGVDYFRCGKCGSLRGGIWGKGPLKFHHASGRRLCRHRWQAISRDEFVRRSVDEYGDDLSDEDGFWRNETAFPE